MTESHANRGKYFEQAIEHTNEAYLFNDIGVITKIPTDWIVIRDYRDKSRIVKAFPGKKSTVDFMGVAHGLPLGFEAKSSKNKTSFPISNIKEHQIDFLEKWAEFGGLAFYLINFSTLDRTFLLYPDQLKNDFLAQDLKSIPLKYFEENCKEVFSAATMPIHYIDALKEHFKE